MRGGEAAPVCSEQKEGAPVRWVYVAVVVVFVAAILIFLFQNTQSVSVTFLSFGMAAPIAVVVLVVYVLGALTGGSLYALLRRSIQGSRANS